MGLIKAGLGAVGGVLADQWKEFFYCDSMDKSVLVTKGKKRTGGRSSNTRGSDNVISNGSGIAVADGQCMIIVEQGKIVEACAEPGEFTYNTSTEPSIFTGKLGDSLKETFKTVGKRFTYGGDTGKDQRVYYINTKELIDNKFGTPNPIMFRIAAPRVDLYLETSLRCSGVYSYRIVNPLLFYTNVCSNVRDEYLREELDGQLKTEFISALHPALGKLADLELLPSQITAHTMELEDALNEALSARWGELRGLKIVSVAIGSVTIPEEDADVIKQAQRAEAMSNTRRAAAGITLAQGDAMRAAASNTAGATAGFMGVGMAMNAGGVNGANLFAAAQQEEAQRAQQPPQQAQPQQPAAGAWICPACGAAANGKFCTECGAKKPEDTGWTCACGAVNKGKFCSECGSPKPAEAPLYRCDKCGWEPEDPHHPPKFCPECGDPFDARDIKQ